MSLKPLMKALQSFPGDKKSFLPFFGKLTLQDLGFYVEDVHAMKYFEDSSYPIIRHAFMLENALKQVEFVGGSEGDKAGFFPVEWKNKQTDRLGCSTLCDDAHVTLCWFVLPPGRKLPLHDHPTMSVWQRVLFGKLKITSVDWVAADGEQAPTNDESVSALATRRANVGGEGVVVLADTVEGTDEPIEESQLMEKIHHFSAVKGGGVLHELENVDAKRPALFVDIIAPPYLHPPSEIPCTYYDLRKVGAPETPLLGVDTPRGVITPVAKGDRVLLTPRNGYDGPEMNAFARLSDE